MLMGELILLLYVMLIASCMLSFVLFFQRKLNLQKLAFSLGYDRLLLTVICECLNEFVFLWSGRT